MSGAQTAAARRDRDFIAAVTEAIEKHIGIKPDLRAAYLVSLALNRMEFVIVETKSLRNFDEAVGALREFYGAVNCHEASLNSHDPAVWQEADERFALARERASAALQALDHQSAAASSAAVSEAVGLQSPEQFGR